MEAKIGFLLQNQSRENFPAVILGIDCLLTHSCKLFKSILRDLFKKKGHIIISVMSCILIVVKETGQWNQFTIRYQNCHFLFCRSLITRYQSRISVVKHYKWRRILWQQYRHTRWYTAIHEWARACWCTLHITIHPLQ